METIALIVVTLLIVIGFVVTMALYITYDASVTKWHDGGNDFDAPWEPPL